MSQAKLSKGYTLLELLVVIAIIGILAVALFELLYLRWLQIPWTPIALVGTALAFLLVFQNNVAYERTWDARRMWGGMFTSA